ncbi:putrescine hydroxycinnamoyltransferase 1-like [Sorghum bicolor]|uniref:putrescine hydroxycinnamoyltransferase 1-like n=1 Tax=Sorghum bicolor TaxID=4558 RepID=UPI000B423F94|nr:putrescine hydroxycinnamoyltransferase 1-like [Sorghum bicolor]|eukprot:XP_021321788.1 putrescine hydroxycinnamoyltransferase 1-like [Sorghum bicolor]
MRVSWSNARSKLFFALYMLHCSRQKPPALHAPPSTADQSREGLHREHRLSTHRRPLPLQMWAAIARGDDDSEATTSLQPCLDRTLLRGCSPPAVRFQHPEYPRQHGSGGAPSKTTMDVPLPFDTAVFPISKDQVDALKGAAAGAITGGNKKVSTYSAVVAHVWQCSCKAKRLSGTEDSQIYGVGCLRSRMCPPLPRVFFGNAVALTSTTVTKVKDIVSSPLNTVAGKVTAAAAAARPSDEPTST